MGYLGGPVYYLECQCAGTYIVWNHQRQSPLSAEDFGQRLTRAIALAGDRPALLIRNRPITADDMKTATGFSLAPLAVFDGAETDENFWLYRVNRSAQ